MSNDVFRVKLVTKKTIPYCMYNAKDVMQYHMMMKKFLYPTYPKESDIVIKGYCVDHIIYLEAQRNSPIYSNIDDFIRDLCITYRVESFELDFMDVEHSFFDEFQISFSSICNVKNGVNSLINIISNANKYVTEEEKELESYKVFIKNHEHIITNYNYFNDALSKYLFSYSYFLKDLDSMSSARVCFWGSYERIHTDQYSAQEHF